MKLLKRISIALFTGVFLFAASPSYAGYYGYGAGYGHYGGHFSYHSHGHGSELGYALLGLTGLILLVHLFDQSERRYYERPRVYHPPRTTHVPARRTQAPVKRTVRSKPTVPVYDENAGWDRLARGKADQAQDVFAVQSQQNLNSGTYKIGFALAAALNGDLDRGTRAMRRALRMDPASINKIDINDDIDSKLMMISDDYRAVSQQERNTKDQNFMIAALSFIQKDYTRADNAINEALTAGDRSQSTRNLNQLISERIIN